MYSVMISGGGTGGHIFPAISIAQEIKDRYPECKILFVGAKGKMEMQKVPQAGFSIKGLPISGIQRKLSFANFLLPFKLFYSVLYSINLILKNKPQVVIGVGGFASGPLLIAAVLLFRKVVIQEQNSFPGITNRLVSRRASLICVAYHGMEKFFPISKIKITGNPVRKIFLDSAKITNASARHFFHIPSGRRVLFVTGGSLGAKSVNEAICSLLPLIKEQDIHLIWQTGKPFFQQAKEEVNQGYNEYVHLTEFLTEMHYAYAASDLVVSRAGAGAISEIAVAGCASILVPYPFAAEDHQTFNARALSEKGAAILISDRNVKSDLAKIVTEIINDDTARARMKTSLKSFALPRATTLIVDEIERIL